MKDYHINIFHSAEDGGYITDIPDLAMCSAFGATQAAALREAQKAKRAWLASTKELGKPSFATSLSTGLVSTRPSIGRLNKIIGSDLLSFIRF
jgi:predicted RNase H-like HicB family nuclease